MLPATQLMFDTLCISLVDDRASRVFSKVDGVHKLTNILFASLWEQTTIKYLL